jgi:hypothetical protein
MDYQTLYSILSDVARRGGQITYTELSEAYAAKSGEWIEPHGGWDDPLGELNRALQSAGHGPLSAVVVLKETREPGGKFWESSSNVPRRPANGMARSVEYGRILGEVHASQWPDSLPGSPSSSS